MKRIISVVLTSFILLTTLFTLSAFANNAVELKLNDITVYAGDEFELKLIISDNSQLSGAVIDITYDKNMFEFISAEKGVIIGNGAQVNIKNIAEKSCVRFTYMDPSSSITSEGVLVTVKFKALDNSMGQSSIGISIPNSGDFVSSSLEKIPFTVKASTVNVINNTSVNDETTTEDTTVDVTLSETQTTSPTTNESNDAVQDNSENIKVVIGIFVTGVVFLIIAAIYFAYNKKRKR